MAAAAGSWRVSRRTTHGMASNIPAENVTASGMSVTPFWLYATHMPLLPRIRVASHAARQLNSRRNVHQ